MKYYCTKQIILSFIFILLSFSFSYAGFGGIKSTHNNEIPQELRDEMHMLNKSIISSIGENNPQYMYELFIEEVKEKGISPIKEIYQKYADVILKNNFHSSHDYHIKYLGIGEGTFPVLSETDPGFLIHVTMSNKGPKFVSMMESKGNFQDYILIFIYEKINSKWHLQTFHIGIARIAGNSPIDWYNKANNMFNKGQYLPAFLRLSVAGQFIRPAPFIQYKKEKDIEELYKKCKTQIEKHRFPIPVQLKTKPKILSIVPQFAKSDFFPLINYLSEVSFENEAKIKNEANNMLPLIEEIFPGISSYGKYVVFKAFNEIPSDPKKQYRSYGIVINVNE